jgi:hypothetical protein
VKCYYSNLNRFMCNWLLKHSIVSYFFGEQAHPEILKRAHTILCLLSIEGEIHPGDLDLIWAFATSEVLNKWLQDCLMYRVNMSRSFTSVGIS